MGMFMFIRKQMLHLSYIEKEHKITKLNTQKYDTKMCITWWKFTSSSY